MKTGSQKVQLHLVLVAAAAGSIRQSEAVQRRVGREEHCAGSTCCQIIAVPEDSRSWFCVWYVVLLVVAVPTPTAAAPAVHSTTTAAAACHSSCCWCACLPQLLLLLAPTTLLPQNVTPQLAPGSEPGVASFGVACYVSCRRTSFETSLHEHVAVAPLAVCVWVSVCVACVSQQALPTVEIQLEPLSRRAA